MDTSFFRSGSCDAHICICCQTRIEHPEKYAEGCTLPAEMTCYTCAESETEGYCWMCNHDGR
jgi:hypothetical protein